MLATKINNHLDNACSDIEDTQENSNAGASTSSNTRAAKGTATKSAANSSSPIAPIFKMKQKLNSQPAPVPSGSGTRKRHAENVPSQPTSTKRSKASHTQSAAPLAERLRPSTLSEFVGQPHLTGPDSLLMQSISKGSIGSMIFWGPPGYLSTGLVLWMSLC